MKKTTLEEFDKQVLEALETPLPTQRRPTSGALRGLVDKAREKREIPPRGS